MFLIFFVGLWFQFLKLILKNVSVYLFLIPLLCKLNVPVASSVFNSRWRIGFRCRALSKIQPLPYPSLVVSPEALLCQAQTQNPLLNLTPRERSRRSPQGSVLLRWPGPRPPGRAAVPSGNGDKRGRGLGQGPSPPPHGRGQRGPGPGTPVPCHDAARYRGRAGAVRRSPPQRRPGGVPPGGRQEAAGAARPLGLSSLHPSAPDGEEASAAGAPPHGRGQPGEQPSAGRALSPPRSARRSAAGGNALAGRGPPPRPGCGGGERSPGPAPAHKGEARNRARTGRRTRRVGGSVPPRGGSGGGAAVTAGRGRGLCPGILPKKAAGLFSPLSRRESPAAPSRLFRGMAAGRPAGLGAAP